MAHFSSQVSKTFRSALDPFQKFVTQIALELQTFEVKIIKSLIIGKLPALVLDNIDCKVKFSAIDLFTRLQEYRYLSENDLSLLKEALETAGRVDLAEKVEDFEKRVVELKDVTLLQMNNLPAPNTVLLRLLLGSTPTTSELDLIQQTNGLRETIIKKLDLNLQDVAYVGREDASLPDCIFVIFQFPKLEPKIMQLNVDALNKAAWLVNLGVLQLRIGEQASINIKENLQDIRPLPKRQTSVLAVNPSFAIHQEDALDVILGIELPSTASPDMCKHIFMQCQSALDFISQIPKEKEGFDMKLAVITYGNHSSTSPLQPTAFMHQSLSKNFDIVKNKAQCDGNDGLSGIADALEKVVEIAQHKEVRNEATKVCILITFLDEKSCNPEHYRCPHGNDIIKLCDTLAKSGITLYIIGIDIKLPIGAGENHLLSGIATFGGGQYLKIDDISTLAKTIACIIKHDVSMEKQSKTSCEVLIEEINRKCGIVNVDNLARHLKRNLHMRSSETENLSQNGENMKPVSQIAKRVGIADDFEDAINVIKTMTERSREFRAPRDDSEDNFRSCSIKSSCSIQSHLTEENVKDRRKYPRFPEAKVLPLVAKELEDGKHGINLMKRQGVDLETAARMVKRQIHRLEYQKISEEQNPE